MSFLITRKPSTIEGYEEVITSDYTATLSEMTSLYDSKDFTINAETYGDVKAAIESQVKYIFNGTLVEVHEVKTQIKKCFELFNAAVYQDELDDLYPRLERAMLAIAPRSMTEAQAISSLKQLANTEEKEATVLEIEKAYSSRRSNIKDMVKITSDRAGHAMIDDKIRIKSIQQFNENLQKLKEEGKAKAEGKEPLTLVLHRVSESAEDLQGFVQENKGIHLVTWEKGVGKSKMLSDLFKSEMKADNYPVYINSSRTLAGSNVRDEVMEDVYYKNIQAEKTYCAITNQVHLPLKKGVFGVINSVIGNNDYKFQKGMAKTFMGDELEAILNHMTGEAVGKGRLHDMEDIMNKFEALFSSVDNILFTDAMMSVNTLEYIHSINHKGLPIYIHERKSEHKKPVIKIMPEAMNMALTEEAISKGKVAVFCDGKHNEKESVLNQVVHALKTEKHAVLDSNFMNTSKTADQLKDMKSFTQGNDVIFYNTAAKCGLSIEDQDYTVGSLFACMTADPSELVQAQARPRMAQEVYTSFRSVMINQPTNEWGVASAILFKEKLPGQINAEEHMKIMNGSMSSKVIKRIAYKNRMRQDYINTYMIMLDILGYKIEIVEQEDEKAKKGRKTRSEGKTTEKTVRRKGIINAERISKVTADKLKMNGDMNSQENKNRIEAYDIREKYNISEITADVLDFDKEGKGRTLLDNMKAARGVLGSSNTAQAVKTELFIKFFELTGLCPREFGKYTADDAKKFTDFIDNGEIYINNEYAIKAKSAFYKYLPDCSLSTKMPTKTITSILRTEFRLEKPESLGRENRNGKMVYGAVKNELAEAFYAQAIKSDIADDSSFEKLKEEVMATHLETINDDKASEYQTSLVQNEIEESYAQAIIEQILSSKSINVMSAMINWYADTINKQMEIKEAS